MLSIEELRDSLYEQIHESIPVLEDISDLELCTMDDYDELIDIAETVIEKASYEELKAFYDRWIGDEEVKAPTRKINSSDQEEMLQALSDTINYLDGTTDENAGLSDMLMNIIGYLKDQWVEKDKNGCTKPACSVPTSAGVLKAYPCTDPDQPGISVMLQPAGFEDEIDAAFVSVYENPEFAGEGERPVDVAIMCYGDARTEDYTHKEVIKREDILEGLGASNDDADDRAQK